MNGIRIPSRLLTASNSLAAAALLGSTVFSRSRGARWMPEVEQREVDGREADLYVPPGPPAPGIVLAPGALREGRRYPILESTARAIAACGFAVLVPELGRLRRLILGVEALDELVEATHYLPSLKGALDAPVGLIGFSLGGSLALLAAGDERVRERVACVAAMGSYFRLTDMLDAAVSGFTGPRGTTMTLAAPSAYAIAASLADRLAEQDRRVLFDVIDRQPESPLEALSRLDSSSVGPTGRLVLELLRTRDRKQRDSLIESVPGLAQLMATLSPERVIDSIDVPTWVMHDERDQYVPFTEFRALREAAAGRDNFTFLGIRLLEHTEPAAPNFNPRALFGDYLPGLSSLFRFARGPIGAVRRAATRP